jgi:hypothetical protein
MTVGYNDPPYRQKLWPVPRLNAETIPVHGLKVGVQLPAMGLSEHVVPHGAPEISTSSSLEVRTSFLVNQLPAKLRHVRRDVNLGIDFVGQGWATGSLGTNKAKNCWAPWPPLERWNNGKMGPPPVPEWMGKLRETFETGILNNFLVWNANLPAFRWDFSSKLHLNRWHHHFDTYNHPLV